jgi:hypothetical protein
MLDKTYPQIFEMLPRKDETKQGNDQRRRPNRRNRGKKSVAKNQQQTSGYNSAKGKKKNSQYF